MSEQDYSSSEADRRLGNMVRIGTVAEFDPAQGVRVDLGELTTDWLPIGVSRAGKQRSWNPKDIGEQVVILAPDGEVSQGVVVCSIHQDKHPANGTTAGTWRETFDDGTVVEYDQANGGLRADVATAGSITLRIGSTVLVLRNGQATLTADDVVVQSPQTTFTGAVTVQGLLTYQAGIAGTSGGGGNSITGGLEMNGGSVTHDGKNIGSTHTHTGVQSGGSATGAPS